MPCLAIHLAVAKKYLEKHPEENIDEFMLGSIAPDITLPNPEKYISLKQNRHFGENNIESTFSEYMRKKISFKNFFNLNDINTSFLRAYFLHLICDYYFFNEYINKDVANNMSFSEAVNVGYNDYNIITPILIEKYNLEIPTEIKEKIDGIGVGELKIINEEKVYEFIEIMSDTDLNSKKEELKNI